MDILFTSIAAIVTGIVIGICAGMLGIGGGTIMVPAYRLLFGMTALGSTATSLFTIIPTSLSGAATHIRNKTCHIPLGLVLGIGGACTSSFGVWLATISPGWLVMLVAAFIIGYSAIDMFIKAMRLKPTSVIPGGEAGKVIPEVEMTATAIDDLATSEVATTSEGAAVIEGTASTIGAEAIATSLEVELSPAEHGRISLQRKHIVGGILIGLIAGLASGYIGVGGGFIMVPLMLTFLKFPLKQASGTSLIAIIVLAIPGVITQGILGNIDYLIGVITAVGSIPGAFVGASLANRISERTLRFIFSAFLIVAAFLLALNEFHVIG